MILRCEDEKWQEGKLLSRPLLVWHDGGLDDRAQVLRGGKLVAVVFAMEVAS